MRRRIFLGTIDARLIALDAATGQPCADFGAAAGRSDGGHRVRDERRRLSGDLAARDHQRSGRRRLVDRRQPGRTERGVVRAFDARTGALRWSWEPVPTRRADPARATWDGESWRAHRRGERLVGDLGRRRSAVSCSCRRQPEPRFLRRRAPGANATRIRWSRCAVDRARSSGTSRSCITTSGTTTSPRSPRSSRSAQGPPVRRRRAGTKMGTSSCSIATPASRSSPSRSARAEERRGRREGSPTQPFPTAPRAGAAETHAGDAWGTDARTTRACREQITRLALRRHLHAAEPRGHDHLSRQRRRHELGRRVARPGARAAGRKHQPACDRGHADPARRVPAGARPAAEERVKASSARSAARRSRCAASRSSPSGVPCNPPPWGTLAAVDLATGDDALGGAARHVAASSPRCRSADGARSTSAARHDGGGLIFIGAAVDTTSAPSMSRPARGLERRAAGGRAGDADDLSRRSGKQFVVIAAGGHSSGRSWATTSSRSRCRDATNLER